MNVNRPFNKLDSVKELIEKYSFDILALFETWLTSEISDSEISIMGYSIVRKDRQNSSKACSGVLIYVRDGIPFIRQANFVEDNFECLWIEINRRFCKPMAVGVVCRPGYLNIEDFVKALTRILDNTDLDKVETIILGDFYVDYSAKEKSLTLQVGRICTFSFNLTQIISRPTRVTETTKSTIDLLLVNNNHKIVQCDVLNLSISDPSAIFCVMKGGVKKLPPKVFEYRSFKSYEKKAFINDLKQVSWSITEGVGDIDDTVFLWEKLSKIVWIITHLLNQGTLKECQPLGFLTNFWK